MCSVIGSDMELTLCQQNGTSVHSFWLDYKPVVEEYLPAALFTSVYSMLPIFEYHPWVFSLIGSTVIGLSGIFPLLVIPIEEEENFDLNGAGKRTLKVLLSFAVGCLLGDVFLHLLPEVWIEQTEIDGHPSMNKGLWILAGLLIFIVLEKIFAFLQENEEEKETEKSSAQQHSEMSTTKTGVTNGFVSQHHNNNNYTDKNIESNGHLENDSLSLPKNTNPPRQRTTSIHVSGYLNLMANSFDNFTHGLAVGGSFLVSLPHGLLTTFAILLHEIPHEVGDFAILLRSGFTRWDAAKAQVSTASAGIIGALTAVALSGGTGSIEARTSWMLPFTAGGFLHIALVTVLPDLLKEDNPKESFTQLASLLLGIGVMAALNIIVEE